MSARLRFWIVTVAALLAVVVTAALGRWQLHRAAEKQALQAALDERGRLPEVDALSLVAGGENPALLHRRIVVRGNWLLERSVFLDNRQMNGRVGFFVLTPLRLADSSAVVLVQRGWAPRNFEDRTRAPLVATPTGPVTVHGLIASAPAKLYELGDSGGGAIRQNLDLAQFRQETGLPLTQLTIRQSGNEVDGLLRDWPPANTGVEKHYGYAFQWFGLCTLIAALYVWFQIVRRFQRRAS